MAAYALFKYHNSGNIGDEIQSLAARQFLPRVDAFIDRDNFGETKLNEKTKVIANGWYTHRPDLWPPRTSLVHPLFVSMHIAPSARAAFSTTESIDYLKRYEPIGCRDLSTQVFLNEIGVRAYYSGCLTLTLKRRSAKPTERIVICEPGIDIRPLIPPSLRTQVVFVQHLYNAWLRSQRRIENWTGLSFVKSRLVLAEKLLNLYAGARFVVTGRLHCALPCVAMGVPVLYLIRSRDDPRFGGLLDVVNHQLRSNVLAKPSLINWMEPEPNPNRHLSLRKNLEDLCRKFVEDC